MPVMMIASLLAVAPSTRAAASTSPLFHSLTRLSATTPARLLCAHSAHRWTCTAQQGLLLRQEITHTSHMADQPTGSSSSSAQEASVLPLEAPLTPGQDQNQDQDQPTTTTDAAAAAEADSTTQHGSKRPKESKQGHYEGPQKAKKQKKRLHLVDTEDDLKSAEYYYENDLRKIKPYFFKYQTFAKGRWLGRKIIEVFNTEFRDRDLAFYERAIKDGRIKVNGETVSEDYIVRNSDIVAHDIHRHEPPVADLPVKVVLEKDGVIIVDKPSSIPVHPSGRYRHNTVLHILMKEQGYKDLFPVNRLDRLTSGLLIMALSVKRAREFESMMQKCEIHKEYVCKVKGHFPSGTTECHEPIHVACFKLTLNTVHPDGKPCSTIFELLRYDPDSDTSIVFARPKTGRTHQIRVHLQWLGYPITNDPLYHNQAIWGERNGQGGISEEKEKELVQRLLECGDMEDEADFALATAAAAAASAPDKDKDKDKDPATEDLRHHSEGPEFCKICDLPSRADPEPEKRIMYLHAWKYQAKEWSFETDLPEWAKSSFPLDTVSTETVATIAAETATLTTATNEAAGNSKETGTSNS